MKITLAVQPSHCNGLIVNFVYEGVKERSSGFCDCLLLKVDITSVPQDVRVLVWPSLSKRRTEKRQGCQCTDSLLPTSTEIGTTTLRWQAGKEIDLYKDFIFEGESPKNSQPNHFKNWQCFLLNELNKKGSRCVEAC